MPNRFARVPLAWPDDRLAVLTADGQLLYFQMLRQPDLSRCGVLSFLARRIARQTVGMTDDRVETALDELVTHGLVQYDADTGEALVVSYFADDGVLQHGWGINAAVAAFPKIHSARLREAVLARVPTKLTGRFVANDDGALPFPQDHENPQDDAPGTYTSLPHADAVDDTTCPQHPTEEREKKVLAAVVERRIRRARESGTVIHSEAAYKAKVVDQVCAELLAVARRALVDNPHRSEHELAAILDSDRPPAPIAVSVRTHEQPSRDPRTGDIWWER